MAHNFGIDIGAFGPTATRHLTLLAGFAGLCLLAFLVAGVGQSVLRTPAVRPVSSHNLAQAAHCSQFIELARALFGAEWKRRLDPRDTLCAQQVQQAWERDWQPRETPPEPVLQPKILASAARPSKIAPPEEEPAQRSKTYALAAVTDANASAAKPVRQEASPTKPAGQGTSTAKPSRQDTSTAKRQDMSTADFADQEDATDSSDTSEYDHPGYAAFEDGDQDAMVVDEHGQDRHAFSPSDDPDHETRTLNNEQAERRSRYDDDMQRPPYDGEVDEYDDIEAR